MTPIKPTQEQVIAWAREAGISFDTIATILRGDVVVWDAETEQLERFAALAYEAGRKDENEAAIEDARTVGGEAGAEMEKLIRARREQCVTG